eukprot:5071599-Ditylum_brightwellii.AAC.1
MELLAKSSHSQQHCMSNVRPMIMISICQGRRNRSPTIRKNGLQTMRLWKKGRLQRKRAGSRKSAKER